MTTTTHSPPTVVKWPFFAGDGLCIAMMAAVLVLADRPLSGGATAAAVVCMLVGVVLAIIPYLIDYEARLRVAELRPTVQSRLRSAKRPLLPNNSIMRFPAASRLLNRSKRCWPPMRRRWRNWPSRSRLSNNGRVRRPSGQHRLFETGGFAEIGRGRDTQTHPGNHRSGRPGAHHTRFPSNRIGQIESQTGGRPHRSCRV